MTFSEQIGSILKIENKEILDMLAATSKIVTIKKGDYICRIGQICQEVHILIKGTIRGFLYDEKGNEVTDCLWDTPGNAICGFNDFFQPCGENIQMLEDSTFLRLSIPTIFDVIKKYPETQKIVDWHVHFALDKHWEEKMLFMNSTTKERYLWFCEHYASLAGRVPDVYIASYLGMTPVSLSRIKTQIKKE